MQRPVILLSASLVAGIVAADALFYRASVAVPPWLGACLWGSAALIALAAWLAHRWQADRSIFVGRPLFMALVALFFAIVGFARYAAYADGVQTAWSGMERPPVNRGNPDEFDYRRWRWVSAPEAQVGEERAAWKDKAGEPDLRNAALRVRERLLRSLHASGLTEQHLAVVAAISLGDRSRLSRDTRDLYAAAGASHLLALSGLHLGIIVGVFVMLLTTRLTYSRWRWPLSLLVVAFIWGYAFVAGLPPSLVRASLMTSLLVLLSCVHRRRQGANVLLATVLLMLLVRPVYLFDVGAQLSCLAVAGILFGYQPFIKWCYARWRFVLFRLDRYRLLEPLKLLAVSVCAQLFTWPLVLLYFHQYPLYGALFSIVLVPLTTVLVYGAMAVMVTGLVWTAGAAWMAKGVGWLVGAQLWVMHVETQLPGAVIPDFWSRKAAPQLVVYNNWRCPALHLIASPEQSWLLMPQPERADSGMVYIANSFWKRRLTAEPVVLRGRKAVAAMGMTAVMLDGGKEEGSGKTAAHTSSEGKTASASSAGKTASASSVLDAAPSSAGKTASSEVDVLWITRGFRGGSLEEVAEVFFPRLVVLDASLPSWQRAALETEARRRGWPTYDVAQRGACRLAIPKESEK